jgi:hypothetical protein
MMNMTYTAALEQALVQLHPASLVTDSFWYLAATHLRWKLPTCQNQATYK